MSSWTAIVTSRGKMLGDVIVYKLNSPISGGFGSGLGRFEVGLVVGDGLAVVVVGWVVVVEVVSGNSVVSSPDPSPDPLSSVTM